MDAGGGRREGWDNEQRSRSHSRRRHARDGGERRRVCAKRPGAGANVPWVERSGGGELGWKPVSEFPPQRAAAPPLLSESRASKRRTPTRARGDAQTAPPPPHSRVALRRSRTHERADAADAASPSPAPGPTPRCAGGGRRVWGRARGTSCTRQPTTQGRGRPPHAMPWPVPTEYQPNCHGPDRTHAALRRACRERRSRLIHAMYIPLKVLRTKKD